MTTIVTGATGRFGRRVTEQLLEHLHPAELILTTRNPTALAGLAARGAHVRYADFDEPETLPDAFEGGDRMLLISTLSVGRRAAQHQNAIEAARKAGIRHIAYTSSGGARPDNPALVIADHLQTEAALKHCGVAFTVLRDALYAEVPLTEIGPRALESGKWIASAGDGQIAFVAKSDCTACAAKVLMTPGHEGVTYEITGPELLSHRDAAALTSEFGGKPIEYVVVTDDEMTEMLVAAGVPRRYEEGMYIEGVGTSSAEDIVSYERGIRGNYFALKSDDVQKLLGRPPISLRQVYEANAEKLRKP
ncbi:MAG: SDR family oxidoreductase [Gammaproteobacteria bacterium]